MTCFASVYAWLDMLSALEWPVFYSICVWPVLPCPQFMYGIMLSVHVWFGSSYWLHIFIYTHEHIWPVHMSTYKQISGLLIAYCLCSSINAHHFKQLKYMMTCSYCFYPYTYAYIPLWLHRYMWFDLVISLSTCIGASLLYVIPCHMYPVWVLLCARILSWFG